MTRTEGIIRCLPCSVVYGTVYADLKNADTQVWANRTVPEVIPTYCTECRNPLTRTNP